MVEILLIAYFFPPVGGAGVQRALTFARYLPEEGFAPTVIAGPVTTADRWAPVDGTLVDEIPGDVRVHRVPGPAPAPSGRSRSRLERWLSRPRPFSSWWIESATELGLRVTSGERLILATMSPFESGEVAHRLSERLGIPWIADLRDPWALDEMQVYPSSLHRKIDMRRMERLLSTASAIVMNTPEATAALRAAFASLDDTPVATITNGFDASDFEGKAPPRRDGTFRIVHTGYLHTDMGLWLKKRSHRLLGGARSGVDILTRSHARLLEALEMWCARRPEIRDSLELVLAGSVTEGDRSMAAASPVAELVRFPGYLSHAESVELVRGADLLFLPMHDLPPGQRSSIVPGKTYEYMASGRPILAAVPDGDTRDFLERCGSALVCRPADVAAMVRSLDTVYDGWAHGKPVARSDDEYVASFERRKLVHELAAVLAGQLPETESGQAAADAGPRTSRPDTAAQPSGAR
jgi:glycosyltransferase involved in cell wall biosynthesis